LRTVVDPATGSFAEAANQQVKQQFEHFMSALGMGAMV
jgi:hypothetical protein